jgi:hypothetical protein
LTGLSHTAGPLTLGKWYWRVRAQNVNNDSGPWSASRDFTILPSFDTQFNTGGNFESWVQHPGAAWTVASGSLTTPGLMDWYTSSASHPATFTDFTYEARMKMNYVYDMPWRVNYYGLVVRGTPIFDTNNDWQTAYYFYIYQYYDDTGLGHGCYEVAKIDNGGWSWPAYSCSDLINFNDWNNLKVYANGTTVKFYINDNLMWNSTISSPLSGRLGVFTWLDNEYYCYDEYCDTGDWITINAPTYVDWAKAGEPVLPASALSEVVTPFQWTPDFPSPIREKKGLR